MKSAAYFMILEILMLSPCRAKMKTTEASPPPRLEKMPEALEMRFALSALPPHLRDGASVSILDPQGGYAAYRRGTNGFSCIVVRTEWSWPQLAFRDDIFFPVCYDEEGSKRMLAVWMDVAKLGAQGLGPRQVYEQAVKKFDNGTYQKPSRTRISYMTAPLMRTYPSLEATEVVTMIISHYMFYAPNVKDADIGGKPFSPYPFAPSFAPIGNSSALTRPLTATNKAVNDLQHVSKVRRCRQRNRVCAIWFLGANHG